MSLSDSVLQNRGMNNDVHQPPNLRQVTFADLRQSLRLGLEDTLATPHIALFFGSFFVLAGLLIVWITYVTGTTYWLVLAVLGFPLIGSLAALGFYETSRRRAKGDTIALADIAATVWAQRKGQLPWLATIIVLVFLFWFFLGHMIFALFLGLAPMTNVSTSLAVFLTANGLMMLAFGSVVGAIFAVIVFAISVIGMPLLFDRDIDFMTAAITSVSAVLRRPLVYLSWGALIGIVTLLAMIPAFAGLFIAMPVFGHATWHLYAGLTNQNP